jgi:hypothetical protein
MIMMSAEADESTLPLLLYQPAVVKRYGGESSLFNRARSLVIVLVDHMVAALISHVLVSFLFPSASKPDNDKHD